MIGFLNSPIDVPCPECGRTVSTTLGAVKDNRTVPCSLGHRIELREEGHGIAEAERAIKDVERAIDDMTRKFDRL